MGDTLKDQIDRIEAKLQDVESVVSEGKKDKVKEFKLPFTSKVTRANKKKNYVTIMKVNENRGVKFEKQQIKDQTILLDGVPRLATADYILDWKGNPIIIQPSWSVEPFSPTQKFTESQRNGTNVVGHNVLLARIKLGALQAKKNLTWLLVIGAVVIVGIAAYTYFFGPK